jgi:hypothetical protein
VVAKPKRRSLIDRHTIFRQELQQGVDQAALHQFKRGHGHPVAMRLQSLSYAFKQ